MFVGNYNDHWSYFLCFILGYTKSWSTSGTVNMPKVPTSHKRRQLYWLVIRCSSNRMKVIIMFSINKLFVFLSPFIHWHYLTKSHLIDRCKSIYFTTSHWRTTAIRTTSVCLIKQIQNITINTIRWVTTDDCSKNCSTFFMYEPHHSGGFVVCPVTSLKTTEQHSNLLFNWIF